MNLKLMWEILPRCFEVHMEKNEQIKKLRILWKETVIRKYQSFYIYKYIIKLQKLKHCDMACEQTDRSMEKDQK